MPKVQLMTVSRRGAKDLEYDILRDSDNAILIGGLKAPWTNETTAAAWANLCLADAPTKRDTHVTALETRKVALQAQIDAINLQIADLAGGMTL